MAAFHLMGEIANGRHPVDHMSDWATLTASASATTPIPISSASSKGRATSGTAANIPPAARPVRRRPENAVFSSPIGHPHRFIRDHPFYCAIAVAKLTKNLVGMPADAWRGATDRRFVDLKPRRRLRLPHPSDHRLIELRDDVARHHLLVMDDLAAAQDRRTGHVGGVESLQPLGGGMLSDYSAILLIRAVVLTERADGVAKRDPWQARDHRKFAETLPFRIEMVPAVVAVAGLEHQSGRSFGSAAVASFPITVYCIMPSGHRYEIMVSSIAT